MQFLSDLWMPILVSAVFIFFASFLLHMVAPFHDKDFGKLPDEDKIMAAVEGVPATTYSFPHCSRTDMKNPEIMEKMNKGPIGILTIFPGPVNMGRNLGLTFLFYILVGIFVGYLGWHALPSGGAHDFMDVFRITGTIAFAAHGLGWMPMMVWYGGGRMFWPYFIDAVVYSLITGGTFGWLWPKMAETASAMLN